MTPRTKRARGCTYAVAVDADARETDVAALAGYLSTLGPADCEVLVLDPSPRERFETNRRVLRWVGRHVAVPGPLQLTDGTVDLIRAAVDLAGSEKLIIAGSETRCTPVDISLLCALLEKHDLVEPDEYVAPGNWWGGIEAGRILLHRGVEQPGQVRTTLALRRSAFRPLLEFEERTGDAHLRRLVTHGADSNASRELFVRREPPQLDRWLRRRAHDAAADFVLPLKTAFFMGLLPLIVILAIVGGVEAAGGYAGVVGFASVVLAIKGRAGASRFFPLRACLFAPLWVAERSVSVYWALIERVRRTATPTATPVTQQGANRVTANR